MKDKLLRVGLHTLEFLVVLGASILVVAAAPKVGLDGMSPAVLSLVSGGVLAALAKLVRELSTDYVNLGKGKK